MLSQTFGHFYIIGQYVPSPGGFAETSQDTYDREPPTSLVFHSATQRG